MAKEVATDVDWERAFLEALGSPEERKERKKRADADLRFILDHSDHWREEYPNHWIAVYEANLLAAESSWKRLVKTVTGKRP